MSGWLQRLRDGLAKSSRRLTSGIAEVFTRRRLDDQALEALEDLLVTADLGVATAGRLTAALAKDRFDKEVDGDEVRAVLADQIAEILARAARPLTVAPDHRPHVILFVGVNGSGKTTTIGKFAQKFHDEGRRVMLAAGDTFRAAAVEQLQVWGDRVGVPVIAGAPGADAAAVAFQALAAGVVLGALKARQPVMLAGGSQMLAVIALAFRGCNVGERAALARLLTLGTTAWLAGERLDASTQALSSPALPRLLGRLEAHCQVPLLALACGLHFDASRHHQLQAYEQGHVKEGVGAGGLALLAQLRGVPLERLQHDCDQAMDALLGSVP